MRVSAIIRHWSIVKLSGYAYLCGDLLLLVIGGIGHSWNEITGAILFICTAAIVSYRGDNDRWFALNCALNIPAFILSNLDGLSSGYSATITGVVLYSAGEIFGAVSAPLARHMQTAKSKLLRMLLGRPRKVLGLLSFCSKLAVICDAVAYRHWSMMAVLLLWTLGDALTGLSTPKT